MVKYLFSVKIDIAKTAFNSELSLPSMNKSSLTCGHSITVYYEDTDVAGVVYYANYLKFIERGRTEWLRSLGFDLKRVVEQTNRMFVVRNISANYNYPAFLDDNLIVETSLVRLRKASFELNQIVSRDTRQLFESKVTLACVDSAAFVPKPIPETIYTAVAQWKT